MADLMKTSNPALGQNTFRDLAGFSGDTMTVSGAVNKAGILIILCVASAASRPCSRCATKASPFRPSC